jgi:DNA helicase HerA-like ATPase
MAHARVLRFTPDVVRSPRPGSRVRLAVEDDLRKALYIDRMKDAALPIGVLRNGQPAFVNYDFINSTAGGHENISGISRVATKTSFATWVLYSVLSSRREDGLFTAANRDPVMAEAARPEYKFLPSQRSGPPPRSVHLSGIRRYLRSC